MNIEALPFLGSILNNEAKTKNVRKSAKGKDNTGPEF